MTEPSADINNNSRFKHVFVLCTGRCGSVTFSKASAHFDNYTAGHETRCSELSDARLDYPEGHIEADNRLSWFLGAMHERFGDDAYYVHLTRDLGQVAESYDQRWHRKFSIMNAFNGTILKNTHPTEGAAAHLVETMDTNIRHFLSDKTNKIEIDISDVEGGFRRFAQEIGAVGDIEAAVAEFSVRANQRDNVSAAESRERAKNFQPDLLIFDYERKIKAEKREQLTLKKASRLANSEQKKLRKKYKRMKRLAALLALPWAILLFPITLIALGVHFWRRHKKKDPAFQPQQVRTHVQTAYLSLVSNGLETGLKTLDENAAATPDGAKDLFRSIVAQSDEDWLEHMNGYGSANNVAKLGLAPGHAPRFHRIRFDPLPAVTSGKKVTVVMPVYNAEDTVTLAAQSILDQTWENLELILVNDKSSDGSADVIEAFAKTDPRVTVLHNTVNVGPYVSKNRAALLATGDYITGHDSDDIAVPDRIAQQMAPILDGSADATLAHMLRLNPEGCFTHPTPTGRLSFDGIMRVAMISLLFDRKLLSTIGYWDCVRYSADSELIGRVEQHLGDRLAFMRIISMLCLDHDQSLTNDPTTGIHTEDGLSRVRKTYRDNWAEWHRNVPAESRAMPFPPKGRPFDAPDEMVVPGTDIARILRED